MKERWEIWKKLPSFWWQVKIFNGCDAEELATTCMRELTKTKGGKSYEWELRGPYKCTQ